MFATYFFCSLFSGTGTGTGKNYQFNVVETPRKFIIIESFETD